MALVSLKNISLYHHHIPLLDHINLTLTQNHEKVGLIGRNGMGKSSLMHIINQEIVPDTGQIIKQNNVRVARLEQNIQCYDSETVFDVILKGQGYEGELIRSYYRLINQSHLSSDDLNRLNELQEQLENHQGWSLDQEINSMLSQFKLESQARFDALSGGVKRRVLLAQALLNHPDVLLLDEPTNHLDIDAIQWLESFIRQYQGIVILITHDRAFLNKIVNRIIEIDRGRLLDFKGDYPTFLKYKEQVLNEEAKHQSKFDQKLNQEGAWIKQGVKARRKRNQGRLKKLQHMRQQKKQRQYQPGKASIDLTQAQRSGKKVILAENISYAYDNQWLFKNFSIEMQRGEKIGIIGANGCGKTTLINVLLGYLVPSEGQVTHGTNLQVAYFDQLRSQIDETKTLRDNIGEGVNFLNINGKQKHIISYLQDFLFTPSRAHSLVSSFSGGEKNRALLAKILSEPSNVLILDEPTNDLDIETLEMLEEKLMQYQGTVIVVSHDRQFLDNLVTSSIVFESDGHVQEYIGGYQNWLDQKNTSKTPQKADVISNGKIAQKAYKKRQPTNQLTYAEQLELSKLPERIENLEAEINAISNKMSHSDFYQKDNATIKQFQNDLQDKQAQLEEVFELWETLEAKQNS